MYCFMDVETGGLSTDESLLTLSMLITDENLEPLYNQLNLFIKPNDGVYRVKAQALGVNNIDLKEHDKIAINEGEASWQIFKYLNRYHEDRKDKKRQLLIPVGWNVQFDVGFVRKLLESQIVDLPDNPIWSSHFSYHTLDVQVIGHYLKMIGVLPSTLGGKQNDYGRYFEMPEQDHTAAGDTRMTLEILKKLIELGK